MSPVDRSPNAHPMDKATETLWSIDGGVVVYSHTCPSRACDESGGGISRGNNTKFSIEL